MEQEPRIVLNRIQTPDGTVLISYHVHDYKSYKDTISGEVYMVDGGHEYLRRSVNEVPYIEQSVYDDEPFETIREVFCWGTRGKDGKSPVTYIPLSQLETSHIEAIINTQTHISKWVKDLLFSELKFRQNELA
jgi:hypothetical protein